MCLVPYLNLSSIPYAAPNRPPNPTRSLLKNLPIFFKFSFRFPAAVASRPPSGDCGRRFCGGRLAILESAGVFSMLEPRAGVPKRSTPSLAAVIIALPKVEGSKRAGRFEVLRLAAEEREPIPVGIGTPPPTVPSPTARGVRSGDDC